MTVLAFPYTDRGARNERAGFEAYLREKAAMNAERPGVSPDLFDAVRLCILVMGSIYAALIWWLL